MLHFKGKWEVFLFYLVRVPCTKVLAANDITEQLSLFPWETSAWSHNFLDSLEELGAEDTWKGRTAGLPVLLPAPRQTSLVPCSSLITMVPNRVNITDFQTHCISQFEAYELQMVYLWQCLPRKISLCIDPKGLTVLGVICGLICCCHCGILCLSTWRSSLYLTLGVQHGPTG